MGKYAKEVRKLVSELMEAITESLGLGRHYLSSQMESNGFEMMLLSYYPPSPPAVSSAAAMTTSAAATTRTTPSSASSWRLTRASTSSTGRPGRGWLRRTGTAA